MSLSQDEAANLTTDGINEEFFRLIWLKDELNFGPSLNIPDTIIVRYGQPTNWYFTASNGRIKRKNRQNLMNARIEEVFTKNILGYDVIAVFVNMYNEPDPDTGLVPPSTVEFLDAEGLSNFLYNRPKETSNGILQKFIEPKGTKNEMIRAVWSPKICLLEKAINIHHLHDHRYGLYERCVTLEGPEYYVKSAPLRGPVLAGQIQKICESIVTHISEVTFAQKEVTRLVINFRVDSRDKIWLLYTSSIRLNDMLDETQTSSPEFSMSPTLKGKGRKLVNIDSTVQLPNTVNLNPTRSYEKITARQRIRCISCANETLEDMRHPITYKSIIKHYEHVIHIMTELCANQHTTVLDWPPDKDIVEAAGGIGFGCIEMVPSDDILAKPTRMKLDNPLDEDDLRIPPILRYLHPKLSGGAFQKCRKDPLFLFKTATVCEPCYLVFAEFMTMLLRMGGDLTKLLTPDPAAAGLSSISTLNQGSMTTNGTGRPSSADWRALSTVNRSKSDTSLGRKSYEFNPSAQHRQAKNTAIGLRSQNPKRVPKMPKSIRQTQDVGPLSLGGMSGELGRSQASFQKSTGLSQMSSHTLGASTIGTGDDEQIRAMVAERERNFFKEISQNPQLKDQHPLMHLISAQQKLKMIDEQSGVLMSASAKGKKSIFGTKYGKQGNDKYEEYGIYKQEQPYIINGKTMKPSDYLKMKQAEKEERMREKQARINRKKAREAEMKSGGGSKSGSQTGGPKEEHHLGENESHNISLVSAEESVNDIANTRSAKKHREFLRNTLKGVEQEIVDSLDHIKMPTKAEVKEAHKHGAFDTDKEFTSELKAGQLKATGQVRALNKDIRDLDPTFGVAATTSSEGGQIMPTSWGSNKPLSEKAGAM